MLGLILLLLSTGLLFIYGVGQEVGGDFRYQWQRQVQYVGVGLCAYVLFTLLDYRRLAEWSWLGYLAALVLLALVLTGLGVARNGSRSWLLMPGLGVPFQPAELAKPAVLLFVAWLSSHPLLQASRLHAVLPCLAVVALPVALIVVQPDFGTALVFLPFTLAIVFTARLPWRWIVITSVTVLVAGTALYPRLERYQQDRVKVFLDTPSALAIATASPFLPDRLREEAEQKQAALFRPASAKWNREQGWNAEQSLLAVGSGGLWGKGFMRGTQHVLGFLPRNVASSDFIFSVVGEETGFVGAAGMVCALTGVLLCALRTAAGARDVLGCYVAVGVAVLLFTHTFINIGMTVKAAPIVGLPLPFISHGGSFMLCTMACAGLVQSVHVRRHDDIT